MPSSANCCDTILFDTAIAGVGHGVSFDVWYAGRQLPLLRSLPDARGARIYASASARSLTTILEISGGLSSDAPLAQAPGATEAGIARTERFIAHGIGVQSRVQGRQAQEIAAIAGRAPIAYSVFFPVPADREAEFNRWYDEEHLGILLGCKQWLACRRFKLATPHPSGYTHLALHYLESIEALQSPERDAARATPWRDRLATERWFRGEYRVLHRIVA